MTPTAAVGLDLAALADWFPTAVPGADVPRQARLITGGKSNLTYEIDDGQRTWILRRPPLGHVLATAHDMAREFRVMSALQGTAVPVPRTYALCQDTAVLGVPFYVMEKVPGTTYRSAADLAPLGSAQVRVLSTRLVDTLVVLHSVDPVAVGLGDFGRPEGFLGRQVGRWKKQLDGSYSRELVGADLLYRQLAASVPTESRAGIVHGDYRLDNVLFDGDRLTAVLDWEMATLGDPITDLALLVAYHRLATLPGGSAIIDASTAAGFLTEDEIVQRYAEQGGRPITRFGFYLGLAFFKMAAIFEGIHYRHQQGRTAGTGFEGIGRLTEPLIDAGLYALMTDSEGH
jgi:aminoglycoside phosphotransferase (APT) family kinase protein